MSGLIKFLIVVAGFAALLWSFDFGSLKESLQASFIFSSAIAFVGCVGALVVLLIIGIAVFLHSAGVLKHFFIVGVIFVADLAVGFYFKIHPTGVLFYGVPLDVIITVLVIVPAMIVLLMAAIQIKFGDYK